MSIVLGLNPCLYLKKSASLTNEDRYIAISELVDIFQNANAEKIKYLYHGAFDYSLDQDTINLLTDLSDEFTYIALNISSPLEYCEKIYSYAHTDMHCFCGFNSPLKEYVFSLFGTLIQDHAHNIIVSNKNEYNSINNCNFHFIKNIKTEISISDLPPITDLSSFCKHFSIYNWFFGRETLDIILSDTFIAKISHLAQPELEKILTSLFRGIYFPDYKLAHGIEPNQYTIRAHSDKNIAYIKINDQNTTLIRVHCVPANEKQGGVDRICYTEYDNYVIVFFYDKSHCQQLKYEETIANPKIFRYNREEVIENKTFKLNVRKA
jgi:hypothetical protein